MSASLPAAMREGHQEEHQRNYPLHRSRREHPPRTSIAQDRVRIAAEAAPAPKRTWSQQGRPRKQSTTACAPDPNDQTSVGPLLHAGQEPPGQRSEHQAWAGAKGAAEDGACGLAARTGPTLGTSAAARGPSPSPKTRVARRWSRPARCCQQPAHASAGPGRFGSHLPDRAPAAAARGMASEAKGRAHAPSNDCRSPASARLRGRLPERASTPCAPAHEP